MNEILYAALASFVVALIVGPKTIGLLRRLKAGQQIREAGPKSHAVKAGTPTMGGVIIVAAASVATLIFAPTRTDEAATLLIATVGFGLVGLADDFIKVVARRSLGLRARAKLALQLGISLFIALYVLNRDGTAISIPFGGMLELPPLIFIPLAMATVIGAANAVNITDGLDGLAAGATAIASSCFAVIAWQMGRVEAAVFATALAGACLGFSWFNSHPAQVIMGDTGSLALGGALGAIAVLTGTELVLVIIGGLFVIEILSVILQVTYFRITKGKRIFKMSPLHHHFELSGWAEPKIVTRFWLIGLLFGLVGILSV